MNLLDQTFRKAVEVLRMNATDRGFSACSVAHDADPGSNYRSVWARDSAITLMWSLPLEDPELTACGRRSLETLLGAQTEDGHLPNYVDVATGNPEYAGVGNISGIDGPLWILIAVWNYAKMTGDHDFLVEHFPSLERTMKWLRAHDSNNCGLLEVPEAADWMDLFPRSYHVLYDEILWYRANIAYAEIRRTLGHDTGEIQPSLNRAARIRRLVLEQFWPTPEGMFDSSTHFASTQFSLGRTRYLLSQITPFGFSWRCDVFANLMAFQYGVLDQSRAESVFRFLRGIAIDQPYPVRVLYPAIQPGDPEWRDYFLVHLQNLPDHYHNGGVWPFVGGLWVRFLYRLGRPRDGEEALEKLAEVCRTGIDQSWEFTEWAHGKTGMPMGKAYQAWSAASYVAAYLRMQGRSSIEVPLGLPEEVVRGSKMGLAPDIASGEQNLDRKDSPPESP